MKSRSAALIVCLALVVLTPSILKADVVHLKNGGKIEGRVEVSGDHYIVTTDRNIQVRIPVRDVRSVDVTRTNRDRYREKRVKIREGDAQGLLDLARWCKEMGLKSETRAAYEEILGLDTNHAEAREALGFVKVGDEWLTRAEARPHQGMVRHRGRWVTPEKKAELQDAEERKKEEKRIRKLIRKIGSLAPEAAEGAKARLLAYGADQKLPLLVEALQSADKPVRIYAARELGQIGDEQAMRPLAQLAIEDRYKSVRVHAVQALKAIGSPETVVPFIEKLNSNNQYHRLHAVEALSVFPDRRSVYWLIKTWRGISGGFGKGYIMDATMRAYISDYQLASGGTGFVAVEVADPELGTLTTGVVFEVKVQYVEIAARTQTLAYLTGQSSGYSKKSWAKWWNDNKDTFELASRHPTDENPEGS
ncbi:MAG: HEAT repeat domain-containing protein [Planctomycetota bacterium]|nr:HEAT repeat domain-containing protein [Planctomycetota bacterium]